MGFQLHHIYRFQVPVGVISQSGMQEISRFIASQNMQTKEWQAINPEIKHTLVPNLPEDWRWDWLVSGRGEYVGTFPKRVSKYYYKTYSIRCPQSFIMQIGNLAKQHSEGHDIYFFDFTNRIDWEDGDYGDGGSCWWTDYAGAREMLENNGGMAIRFYDEDQTGIGRAWLVPVDDELYVLFNGYGLGSNSTLKIARVFAMFVNLQYKQISVDNRYGGIYVNGNAGYIIGQIEVIDAIEMYEFDWEVISANACYDCGRGLHDDDVYYGADDMPYCEYCFSETFTYCYNCGETHYRENLTYVESVSDDVCDWCLTRHFKRCPRCNEHYRTGEMERFGEALICPDCSEELKILGDNIE